MSRRDDVPKSVRVRTDPDDGLAHRYDAIEAASERFDCNKSDAIVAACDVAGELLDGVERALEHEDLPPRLARELAEEISTRYVSIEVAEPDVSVDVE